ncbi:mCG1030744 [Mus musculus]|nr:mCG1030744 [Mus musculus]
MMQLAALQLCGPADPVKAAAEEAFSSRKAHKGCRAIIREALLYDEQR